MLHRLVADGRASTDGECDELERALDAVDPGRPIEEGSGRHGAGRQPGSAENRVVEGLHRVVSVLDRGGQVAADPVPVFGAGLAGEAPGDLLLGLGRPQVAFGLVVGGRNAQVVGEAQHVGFAVAQHLQHQAGLAFTGAVAVAGGVGQPDLHTVGEFLDQRVADRGVDAVTAGLTGQVGVVDQPAQRVGDLGRPHRVGVHLGRGRDRDTDGLRRVDG